MSTEQLAKLDRQHDAANTNIQMITQEARAQGSLTDHDKRSIAFWYSEMERIRREHKILSRKIYGEEPKEIL